MQPDEGLVLLRKITPFIHGTQTVFCAESTECHEGGYDLSINRYKEVVHDVVDHLPPKEILAKLATLEVEIQAGMKELEGLLV